MDYRFSTAQKNEREGACKPATAGVADAPTFLTPFHGGLQEVFGRR